MKTKPVIFLAFANDRVDNVAYLRNLPKELNGIREALDKAVQAELCEIIERPNATIQQILDVFQDDRYRNRIAIFHYGGHANGYQLLLENLDGSHAIAHSDGLVGFLARQKALKLVFLNGCSSQQQALDLIEAGISAVIGTSQSINDDVALQIAIRFYLGLGEGTSLSGAWQTAVDEAKILKGTANMRDFFWEGIPEKAETAHFPWELYFREGARQIGEWNLPEAAQNDLFGLPQIPKTFHLPNEPFLFFQKYTRSHAEVFFGRDAYIRKLYQQVTDQNSPPIALFFGLSGAGKSSLLEAGLLPRIEEEYSAIYVRRNQELGLSQSVWQAFNSRLGNSATVMPDNQKAKQREALLAQISQLSQQFTSFQSELSQLKRLLQEENLKNRAKDKLEGLAKLWHDLEASSGKPVILLLDQVEEAFMAGNAQKEGELEQFLEELKLVFGNRSLAPQGAVVLTYRKEFAPELEREFNQLQLPFSKVFLLQLTRNQIIEIILGLGKTEDLKRKYNLTVEPNLPEIIADDLLEDKESPVAPILQILLTKMWQKANEQNPDAPTFTVELYQSLKYQGMLMEDFLHQQLAKLAGINPKASNSGLALDILFFHTNKMGNSIGRNTEEVLNRYKGRETQAEELLTQLEKLYLLNSVSASTRKLSHDTLAMLVRQLYGESVLPGQRASRILQYKMMDIKAGKDALLDSRDLNTVRAGVEGMRTMSAEEEALLNNSEREIKKREIHQSRKEARITFLETENEEKEAEVFLQRIEEQIAEEKRKKHDNSIKFIRNAFEKYPDHTLTKRLIYRLLNTSMASKIEQQPYLQNKFEGALLPPLGPPDMMESEKLIPPNDSWYVKIGFPGRLTVFNQYGYEKASANVSIRDYGVFTSLDFAQNSPFFVTANTDGLVKLFDKSCVELLSLGDYDEDSSHHFRNAIFNDFDSAIICQSGEGLFSYTLNPQSILEQAEKSWVG